MSGEAPAWEFEATGTRWRLYHSGVLTEKAAKTVAAAIELDEARWSRFRTDSEVNDLNRNAGEWRRVSSETFELLEACQRWTRRTGGVFQPLVGAALEAWGYRHSISEQVPVARVAPRPQPVAGAIELDRNRMLASIPRAMTIDLGGIGKGWIASRAAVLATTLTDDPRLLIDAGGDLLAVTGDHEVAVEAVADGETVEAWIALHAGQSIATSGFGRRRWTNGDGRTSHHLIDPETGAPGPLAHATVIAGDAVTADIHAKLLALRPHAIGESQYPALVRTRGSTITNREWDASVVTGTGERTRLTVD